MATAEEKSSGNIDQKKKILVIEDEKFIRDLIVQNLTKGGFEVIAVVDGEEGIKKVKEGSVQLVVLDIILPGIDGFEVLKRLKDDPETASIPVIILSNLGQREDVERGLGLGAVDYLIKAHFTPDEILEKVKSAIGESYA